ncbi:hypothetical protein IRT45_36035 [Nocardia sp. BSTN01]|nr:hypothetical protein [Nocardia sp. BSTN01]MBF5002526.1 hypothetical protein [Nocardia sp. BSTN01]
MNTAAIVTGSVMYAEAARVIVAAAKEFAESFRMRSPSAGVDNPALG